MPLETCASNPFAVGNIAADPGTVAPPSYYYLRTAAFSSAGAATVAFERVIGGITPATLASAGAATATFAGTSSIVEFTTATFTSAGVATVSFAGEATEAATARQAMLADGTFVNVEDERDAMVPGAMVNKDD